jgi:hypothetical protein
MATCNAVALNEEEAAALGRLLQYNWADEQDDYRECDPEASGGNTRHGHIFEDLVMLANAIDGTSKTPLDHLNEATEVK